MTESLRLGRKSRSQPLLLLGILLLLLIAVFFADAIADGVQRALLLCAQTVIPSLFPFMILSDLLGEGVASLPIKENRRLILLLPFFLGALCGFPLGLRMMTELWRQGVISDEEGHYLLTFVNNTGPAFVIAGIGGGLLGSTRIGLFLYLSELLAAAFCALLFFRPLPKKKNTADSEKPSEGSFSFLGSVHKCGGTMLTICTLVVLFSAATSLISVFCKNEALLSFIYSFLEVGGAAQSAAALLKTAFLPALLLLSFAISFGGLSVHLQGFLFLEGTPFSKWRYILAKLIQGMAASLFMWFFLPFL